jgi:hypothetical protein
MEYERGLALAGVDGISRALASMWAVQRGTLGFGILGFLWGFMIEGMKHDFPNVVTPVVMVWRNQPKSF